MKLAPNCTAEKEVISLKYLIIHGLLEKVHIFAIDCWIPDKQMSSHHYILIF